MPFWANLMTNKLEHDKLDDSVRPVLGIYEPEPGVDPGSSTRMQILGNALANPLVGKGQCRAEGMIKNFNTIEEFKKADKSAMLHQAAKSIWDGIKDGSIFSVPSLLSSFIILSFADLKKYHFYYWVGFPALHSDPQWKQVGPIIRLDEKETALLVEKVTLWQYSNDVRQRGFFLAKKVRKPDSESRSPADDPGYDVGYHWEIAQLGDFETGFLNDVDEVDRYVCFADPSNYPENPSWPLRNLLVLIRQRFHLNKAQILCYRDTHARRHEPRSIIIPLAMDEVAEMETSVMPKATGWERTSNGALRPRVLNLAEYMDPTRLADQAVDLNLKLMKWRISPNLNLDTIKNTKCLLLGAGTLGSYVSRNLMGWGVRKITFVDYGSVSFSNPVRQPLFNFDDCLGGGTRKATRAAEALKEIYPGVESEGYDISVPMLGHPMTNEEKTKEDFKVLKQLIDEHDAIFLLMDSRESRWLPTVMGKATGKIVVNAALGFDTYVVMRHGASPEDGTEDTLGCYFCNDVVVAADSMKDQTLDQQCTVTRPGVAAIASALLVELVASILQHPKQQHAPAPVPVATSSSSSGTATYERDPPEHALGIVPHQIRGFLSTFQNMLIRGRSYPFCSACSKPILDAYSKNGWAFVKEALNSRDYVAELSGLAEVQRRAEAAAADVEWSEHEDELADEEEGDGVLLDAEGA